MHPKKVLISCLVYQKKPMFLQCTISVASYIDVRNSIIILKTSEFGIILV